MERPKAARYRMIVASFVCLFSLSGCLTPSTTPASSPQRLPEIAQILDETGAPIPFAQVAVFERDQLALVSSANATGFFSLQDLSAAATRVVFGASGFEFTEFLIPIVPKIIQLQRIDRASPSTGLLRFESPVDLICASGMSGQGRCQDYYRPAIEVAGNGKIWVTSRCCTDELFTTGPPTWVSQDGGMSFVPLGNHAPGTLYGKYALSSNLAIDDAGNVYTIHYSYPDVGWLISYDSTGAARWRVPVPFPILIDGVTIQAGRENEVFVVRHTREGARSSFHRSTDGGRTWDSNLGQAFPCNMGVLGQGASRMILHFVSPCIDYLTWQRHPVVWTSTDGGRAWDAGEPFPVPPSPAQVETRMATTTDEGGNLYVSYVVEKTNSSPAAIYVVSRSANGVWSIPIQVSPTDGAANGGVSIVAAKPGQLAVAWYQRLGNSPQWLLMVAFSVDAHQATPHFQFSFPAPEPVSKKNECLFGVDIDLTPSGRLVVGYVDQRTESTQHHILVSEGDFDFSRTVFLNGPKP